MKVRIRRFNFGPSQIIGQLYIDEEEFCYTLERPWMDNKPNISCIPLGRYICKRVDSPKFGNTFEITNVNDRTHILLHSGNLWSDSHGCVILGDDLGYIDGYPAVLNSRKTFKAFLGHMEEVNSFEMDIMV